MKRLADKYGGNVEPAILVAESRGRRAVFHQEFEWDDTAAAKIHREDQARAILRGIVEIYEDPITAKRQVVQAYIHINDKDAGPVYTHSSRVMGDKELRAQAVQNALVYLQGWQRRHEHLTELTAIFRAINRVAGETQKRKVVAAK